MKIFKDETSFDKCVWVCIEGPYLYMNDTLEELIHTLNTEWELDKHLVG